MDLGNLTFCSASVDMSHSELDQNTPLLLVSLASRIVILMILNCPSLGSFKAAASGVLEGPLTSDSPTASVYTANTGSDEEEYEDELDESEDYES